MGENSAIEWTDHTFNPWIGCMKVSAGCAHCYAETLNHRWGHDNWGPAATTERRRTSEDNWNGPIRWNKVAAKAGQRRRVFCASMADVFEDNSQVAPWRADLFDLIADTPHLDWLLLTKRPQHVTPMLIDAGRGFQDLPPNVWIGTSVENQQTADERIPHLLSIPAHVRFLSCEPLLGPLDLTRYLSGGYVSMQGGKLMPMNVPLKQLHWVITGGESGREARPMSLDWARSIRDQCQSAKVAFFFKQHGEFTPYYESVDPAAGKLLMAEYPNGTVKRVGKTKAGRLLDGRTWDELPTPRSPRFEVPQ